MRTRRRRCRARVAALLAPLALAVALLAPPPATAGCGGPVRGRARDRTPRPPLVLGDSTMIFAVPFLARRGLDADAQGCRQFGQGVRILRARRRAGRLPRIVVLALGANWTVTPRDIGAAWGVLGPRRTLVLVTPRETGGGESADAANERRAARRHPGRVALLDWVRFSRGHARWFAPDGLHLTWAGAAAFVRFVARGVARVHTPRRTPPRGSGAPGNGGAGPAGGSP